MKRKKKKYSFDFISEIIGARVSEILEAVLWHIEQSGYMEELGMGLVLTGGSSNILHIDKLAEQITKLGTRIGEPSGNISNDTEINISDPVCISVLHFLVPALVLFNISEEIFILAKTASPGEAFS